MYSASYQIPGSDVLQAVHTCRKINLYWKERRCRGERKRPQHFSDKESANVPEHLTVLLEFAFPDQIISTFLGFRAHRTLVLHLVKVNFKRDTKIQLNVTSPSSL